MSGEERWKPLCDRLHKIFREELRRTAEMDDPEVGRCQREAEANPGDPDAERALLDAYASKCAKMQEQLGNHVGAINDAVATVEAQVQEDAQRQAELDELNTRLKADKKELKPRLEEQKDRTAAAERLRAEAAAGHDRALQRHKAARRATAAYVPQEPFPYRAEMGRAFADFVAQRQQLNAVLQRARTRFAYFASEPSADGAVAGFEVKSLGAEAVTELEVEVSDWIAQRGVEESLGQLRSMKEGLLAMGWPADHCDIQAEEGLAANVDALAVAWRKRLASAMASMESEKNAVTKFLQDDAKLLQWCRQERTNLEALAEPHHVQEFCASLIQNIGTMDDNFNHLADMGEALLPNRDVAKALIEVNEVWLNLQLYAYERQRHIMIEIHARSKLEDEVRAFSSFSTRLDKWFSGSTNSVKETLELPQDEESKSVVREPLEMCRQLKREFEPFRSLCDHLQEFSARMESIRDNYMTLRRSVFGKLTFLASDRRAIKDASEQRRREFDEKVRDLKEWVRHHSGAESWADLHTKVQALRDRLEQGLADPGKKVPRVSASNLVSQGDILATAGEYEDF
eukprot:TRINITY_DN22646_c0_g1_i1.p1 TRINITY_DN22646_c0_g1~~TRINITY_DN22646_c0_g1_i1.p1  ORF type:complete len:572 (+),score=257.51 TRINITY_DN22646_c0_g1_i1:93-1808(+)